MFLFGTTCFQPKWTYRRRRGRQNRGFISLLIRHSNHISELFWMCVCCVQNVVSDLIQVWCFNWSKWIRWILTDIRLLTSEQNRILSNHLSVSCTRLIQWWRNQEFTKSCSFVHLTHCMQCAPLFRCPFHWLFHFLHFDIAVAQIV